MSKIIEILLKLTKKLKPVFPSEELYLKTRFRLEMGRKLDLNNPNTFSEKIQWLKLYNRKHEYTKMVDKYAVKDYVASIIGEEYIIPTLGVWDNPEDIDWDLLPNQFVLKTTHGGGGDGVIVCRNKSTANKQQILEKLKMSLMQDIARYSCEWPYKNVPRRILAEQYIEDSNGELNDYKFSCFNGNVTDVMVCLDRSKGESKYYFFDKDWKLLPLNVRGKNTPKDFTLSKPSCMDKMFEIASMLSKDLPYARIDLYAVDNRPFFGEITFYPASGFDRNLLPETEAFHGSMIVLPEKTK